MGSAPTVRLAWSTGGAGVKTMKHISAPAVRLAWAAGAEQRQRKAFPPAVRLAVGGNVRTKDDSQRAEALAAPSVRLAIGGTSHEPVTLGDSPPAVRLAVAGPPDAIHKGLAGDEYLPALLVSYVYLKPFLSRRDGYHFRDWVMDSGAYSAANIGLEIKLDEYIEECKRLFAVDPKMTEVFALDVIGDPHASRVNTEIMWKAGVPAIPTFHVGEPWSDLLSMAREYPKIAIGGMVGMPIKTKTKFCGEVFARVWPHKVHGLGIGSEDLIMKYPFHSVDATNWEIGPTAFGRWSAYGGANLRIRGGAQNLRVEVEHFMRVEQRARERWASTWAKLETTDGR